MGWKPMPHGAADKHDLAEARKLIEKCHSGCRIPELEDAERALLGACSGNVPEPEA